MANISVNLEILSTRSGFNLALRHVRKTLSLIEDLGDTNNLGDILSDLGDEELTGDRVGLLLRMLLVDKQGYKTVSTNLATVVSDPSALAAEFEKWKAVDLIAAYHHPDLGLLIANPKNKDELSNFGGLRKRELLVLYVGKGNSPSDAQCLKAAQLAAALFEGESPKVPNDLYQGSFAAKRIKKAEAPKSAAPRRAAAKAPAKAAAPKKAAAPEAAEAQSAPPASAISKGPVRMTPMYSVIVQNELFHNGNVEAWKRIVASYNAKYPDLQVYIYYEGERILDINSLFKWGKVKHGSAIQFAVAGSEIMDVAKLQRYLNQGASSQFEAFLHGPVNNVLKLF